MMAVLFDGRSSSPSGFLLETLLMGLGIDEFPSSVPFATFSSFLRAAAALILCLVASISAKVINGRQEKQTVILDKLCERFTYVDESIRLIFKLLTLSLFQGDFKNLLDELLLLVSYVGTRTSYKQEKVDGIRRVKIK